MKVFVCFEENYHSLATEIGAITDLMIFESIEKALEWFIGRVLIGIKNSFLMDEQSEYARGDHSLCIQQILYAIHAGEAYLTMFKDRQENYDVCYCITVREMEVQ